MTFGSKYYFRSNSLPKSNQTEMLFKTDNRRTSSKSDFKLILHHTERSFECQLAHLSFINAGNKIQTCALNCGLDFESISGVEGSKLLHAFEHIGICHFKSKWRSFSTYFCKTQLFRHWRHYGFCFHETHFIHTHDKSRIAVAPISI